MNLSAQQPQNESSKLVLVLMVFHNDVTKEVYLFICELINFREEYCFRVYRVWVSICLNSPHLKVVFR